MRILKASCRSKNKNLSIKRCILVIALMIAGTILANAQTGIVKDSTQFITLPASEHYHKNKLYTFFWGEHYRKEWHTPVSFRKTSLDTLAGGLIPYQTGGGRQSKSLRVTDKKAHEYVFRSIDKSFGKALPEIALGTFIETMANDQVTLAHPYAALIVAPLAESIDIYHTNPKIYYVPKQPALKAFNDSTGDELYLFEQRPDEDWSTAPNFGNSKKIVSTEKMLEKILEDNDNHVDQKAFVKARLFDMLIGDWGRHEDQWRWATFKDDKKTMYVPVPRDRDNAFSVFDGFFLKMVIKMAHAKHLQSFDYRIKNLSKYNFPARNLDHHLMNELTLEDWTAIAKDIEKSLPDNVIDAAVKQLPPEVYPISGPGIAAKLKSRRDLLTKYATEYFQLISHRVEITGTKDNELFEVKRLSSLETQVNIYKITKDGDTKNKPYYSRIFRNNETKEIRLYGIGGNDQYNISGDVSKSLKVRLIGGDGKDKYVDQSKIARNRNSTLIYDDHNNEITPSKQTKLHLSDDSAIHAYKYDYFKFNKNSYQPIVFYSNDDRVYAGYAYSFQKQQWRKQPFGMQHHVDVKYSFAQKAVSSTYAGTFTELIGKWDVNLFANYDQERWTNFFGLGNETALTTKDRDFNRIRSRQFIGKAGVQRVFNKKHRITFNPYFQSYDIINDTSRFIAKDNGLSLDPDLYKTNNYAGAELEYLYQHINDSVLPTKGFNFLVKGNFSHQFKTSEHDLAKFGAEANFYVPLSRKLSIAVKAGGTTLTGSPEFFQYNVVGTTETLRGHQRDRYYGNSTAYNQNELRWISDVRSHIFNGRIGFFGLYDVGRAWLKGEKSNLWHTSYGGGLILSPFNLVSFSVSYAISEEDKNLHIAFIKQL